MYNELEKKIGNKKIINGGYRTVLFDLRLLKKNYCCCCEGKLAIKRTKYLILRNIFSLVEAEHNTEYLYFCPKCGYYIEYKNQKKISKIQKDNEELKLNNSEQLISKYSVKLFKVGQYLVLNNDIFNTK